ncbi:MAG: GNAT family N-acetyltransferase [candidate division WOR-3 bacterium]|nr:GNAT family N-acetyltransferase [candidate division WOR-3 bacterium]
MITVKQMGQSDIAFAKSLTDIEGWGHLEEDFERFLFLDPAGCYVARQDGRRAGIVTSVSYGNQSFLGNLIVQKEMRGRGIGVKLMEDVIDHLDRKGAKTIELDGVFKAVQTYRILGFKDKYLSMRFVRPAAKDRTHMEERKAGCTEDIEGILRFDLEKTGIDRSMFLEHLIKRHPHTTYTVHREGIAAYAVIRERANEMLHIGPMVAENESAAGDLIAKICTKHINKDLTVGIPCINTAALKMVVQHGFLHRPPSLRMYRGSRVEYERNVYAIVSADAG